MSSVAHPAGQGPVRAGQRVGLLVNSLGGTSMLELGVVAHAAVRLARQRHQASDLPCPLMSMPRFAFPSLQANIWGTCV